MSTGNDTALPKPVDQTQPPAQTTEPAATDRVNFTHPQPVDPDDVELQLATAAAKAEEAGGQGEPAADAVTGTDPKPAPTPQAAAPANQSTPGVTPEAPIMIPKPRFDEALGRASEAERQAAYWRGVAEARGQGTKPAEAGSAQQPAQQAQPTPEQRLTAIHSAKDDLAGKFDAGELSMAEYVKQNRVLDNQEQTIREDALVSKVKPAAPTAAPESGNELYLETLTAQLEDTHAWVKPFNAVATDSEWEFLANKAKENLNARGVPLDKGAISSYELRREISVLIDRFAPGLIADRAQAAAAKGFAFPTAQASPPATPAGLSPQAQARQAALTKAANAPPNITALNGGGTQDPGVPTEAGIENMSDEEISALPIATQNKLLGITAA